MANLQKLFKTLNEYLPYIIKDEMQRREVMRWLEKSLKEQAAYGEEQRRGIQESLKADITRNLYNPEYFKGRNTPELAILNYIKQTNPGLIPGVQAPPDINQQMADANTALAQLVKYQMAGEPPPQEIIDKVSRFFGEKTLTGAAGDIVKQREAEKERGIRGREVGVQEALVPIRKGELGVRLKEIAGQIGDMTAKEGRETSFKLGQERRKYQAMLETKTSEGGDILSEGQLNLIKSNVTEIKQLEDKINTKFSKDIAKEYDAIARDLKAKGYIAADLDTNEKIRGLLTERGYNIEEIKKYMR